MSLENENMKGLVLFSQINRLGSFSAAARLLNISRSSVSKQLAALEKKIGSRLFNRTTRKIALTEVGLQVLQEAHKVELALQTIEHISEDHQSEIVGDIKISCTTSFGRIHLVPLISKFVALYPKLRINLQLDDRTADMVAENIDISIRVGHLTDSNLIARKLCDLSWTLCASPEYLKNAPQLKSPSDLVNHRCLFYRGSNISLNTWAFTSDKGEESITVSGPLSINDPSALVSAALEHAGILLIDKGLLGDTIQQGKLIPILTEYQPIGGLPMYVVFPEREFMPAKTRALINFILEEMPSKIRCE
ncbi:MAG: LysR family transcriptional regulator [Cocleimonas sp.]